MTTKTAAHVPPEKPFHYFGSTAYNWATGATRQEVIEKLARQAGTEAIKRNDKHSEGQGLYCWTCRVGVPQSTDYEISYFQPQGVPVTQGLEVGIKSAKGLVVVLESRERAAS